VYFDYICWKFAGRLLDRVNTLLLSLSYHYQNPLLEVSITRRFSVTGLTQSSVIQIIHHNVGLKCFLFHLLKFLLLSLVFAYIYISQGSVETHLPCGEIYNNHIELIANCLQSATVKEF